MSGMRVISKICCGVLIISNSFAQNTIQTVTNPTTNPQPTAAISPCYNMGFESLAPGSYTSIPGWTLSTASYSNTLYNGYCLDYPSDNPLPGQALIGNNSTLSTPCNTVAMPLSYLYGNNSLCLNASYLFLGILRAERSFSVTAANPFLEYAYLLCTAYAHGACCDATYMKVKLLDNLNNPIPCGSVTINGATGGSTACVNQQSVPTTTTFSYIWTPNWVQNTFDLTPYIGTSVKLKLELGTCTAGAHYPIMMFDARCADKLVTSNGSVSGRTITVCQNPNIATLTAVVANSYTWNGPPTSSITNISASSISTSVSGVYSLSIFNPNCASTNTYTYLVNFCNLTTGLMDQEQSSEIFVYPNPSNGDICIRSNKTMDLTLYDMSGRKIETVMLEAQNGFSKDLFDLKKGVYFIIGKAIRQKIMVLD